MARIVVADDDDDVRAVTARILLRAGNTVVPAHDGAEGLQAVREHNPDLVVSDIDMPRMSGVEFCQAIRAYPATAGLAVLLISGSLTPADPRPAQGQATANAAQAVRQRRTDRLREQTAAGRRPGRLKPGVCP